VEATRAATADDVGRIAELARVMRDELVVMKGGELWAGREARPEPLETAYAELLELEEACLVVGTIDEAVIGFGAAVVETLRSGERLGVITDLYVEPDARAVGVGESMAEALVEHCERLRCVGIDALALPGHRPAKNFFEESGFTARAIVMHRPQAGRG
jgi:ribosomal protein S18 acetylase RimI-like enzyme